MYSEFIITIYTKNPYNQSEADKTRLSTPAVANNSLSAK